MTESTSRPPDAKQKRRLPPLRSDLEVTRRQSDQRIEYVLKDPLSNQHFRMGPEEWFVATLLDGERSLADVHTRAVQQFPEAGLTVEEVARFVRRLALAGMLRLSGHVDLDRLLGRRRKGRLSSVLEVSGRMFYFRIPLVNPDRFVTWLEQRTRLLLRPRTLMLLALIVLAAVAVSLWQWPRLLEPRADFLSPRGLLWLLAAIVFVKVIHEFGHACLCKHYGGQVPEMGIVFIVFTPCLYCDVSDAWMFQARSRRLAVTAAGIAVELVLAAVAALVFFMTREGGLHQACFSIMVVASASTILFNGNPLLRYDGYYLLSDAIEVPNLRIRARRYLVALARRIFLATPVATIERPERHRVLILVYGVASYLYGWFILYAILGVLYRKLEPYNLQPLAAALIVFSLAVQLGVPAWRLLASLAQLARRPGNLWRFARALLVTCGLVFLVATLLSIEFADTVGRTCVVAAARPTDLRADHGGFVSEVLARGGQSVKAGDTLMVLTNDRLDLELQWAHADLEENRISLDRARAAGDLVKTQQLEIRTHQLDHLCQLAERNIRQLAVVAPSGGVVLTDNLQHRKGTWANKGGLLLRLARPGEVKVTLELNQREAERVAVGAAALLRVRCYPEKTFSGTVSANSRTASRDTPAVLTTLYQGEVPVRSSGAGWKAAEKLYRAELQVTDSTLALRSGMSGRARILLGRTTLGRYLWQTVRDQLSLDLLLKWATA